LLANRIPNETVRFDNGETGELLEVVHVGETETLVIIALHWRFTRRAWVILNKRNLRHPLSIVVIRLSESIEEIYKTGQLRT
jgi:hypothetical protein